MDPEIPKLAGTLLGPTGAVGLVAYLLDRRSRNRATAAAVPAQQAVAASERAAATVELVLDELVEARADIRALRQNVWRCPIEHCPVRDHLRETS